MGAGYSCAPPNPAGRILRRVRTGSAGLRDPGGDRAGLYRAGPVHTEPYRAVPSRTEPCPPAGSAAAPRPAAAPSPPPRIPAPHRPGAPQHSVTPERHKANPALPPEPPPQIRRTIPGRHELPAAPAVCHCFLNLNQEWGVCDSCAAGRGCPTATETQSNP